MVYNDVEILSRGGEIAQIASGKLQIVKKIVPVKITKLYVTLANRRFIRSGFPYT